MSLREISNATKISVSALDALERNDISRLPGGIFSRAFVRSYALEVGLDPERTVREFIAAFPEESVAAGHPAAPIEDNESIESERQTASTLLQLIGLSALAALVIWFVVASRGGQAPAPEAAGSEPAPAAVTPSPAPAVTDSVEHDPKPAPAGSSSIATVGRAVPAPNPDPVRQPAPEPAPADHLSIGLAVTRPCWISLTVDGEKAIERLLRPGDSRTFDVQRELVLTAGDAAALAITINGAEVRPLGRAGQVATARFNLANFKDYLQK